jgi:high frequency lysogenization protein
LPDKLENTTIALAGIVQAVSLVRELAQTGKADEAAFQSSIASIFNTDPVSVIDVYGSLSNVRLGLEKLINALGNEPSKERSLMRYVVSLIHLQKKIKNAPQIRNTLKQRLFQTKKQVEYFHLTHPTVIANLADIYLNTISTFKFRIMIWGSPRIMNTSEVMEKIRALLLAGIRSTVLWRQTGGSRLQLLFSRAKIKSKATELLSQIRQNEINEKERL